MRVKKRWLLCALCLMLLLPAAATAQDFKKWEAKISEYKQWLDLVRSESYRLWTRIDSSRRPHRLYVGEGFYRAEPRDKEQFVEVFSHYLAGHPEKFALIDLFDGRTGAAIGEFGWGGFKLYPDGGKATRTQ